MRRKLARALLWYALGILACLVPMLFDGCAPQAIEAVYLPLVKAPAQVLGHWVGATYPTGCADADRLGAVGVYNWGALECEQIMTAQMVYCTPSLLPDVGDASIVLMGNEPDHPKQCNKTPREFADYWNWAAPQLAREGRMLVSPATFTLSWMEAWWPMVEPKPDAIAVHCYDFGGGNVCKDHILSYAKFGVPLMVTEWAYVPGPGEEQVAAVYIADMLIWFDAHRDVIIMDAYFQTSYRGDEEWALFGNTSLINWDTGDLTPMGVAFKSHMRRSDVNGDGCVDILDLVIVASAFGTGDCARAEEGTWAN